MRWWSLPVLFAAFGVAGVVAPRSGWAQPNGLPRPKQVSPLPGHEANDDAITHRARAQYQAGAAAANAGRWQEAYDAYLAAWRLKRHWQIAGSLGQAELELAKHRDAVEHLELFLRDAKDVDPAEITRVRGWLAQAQAKAATSDTTQAKAESPRADREAGAAKGAKSSSPVRSVILIGGASVTGASLALGIASVAIFVDRGNVAEENRETPQGKNSITEADFKSIALWSFVGAGVAGASTLIYYLTSAPSARAPVKAGVVLGPGGGGVIVQGQF